MNIPIRTLHDRPPRRSADVRSLPARRWVDTRPPGRAAALALAVLLLAPLLGACTTTTAAQSGYYDDWYLCADNCAEDDAGCIDACTEEFNNTHASPGKDSPPFRLQRRTGGGGPPVIPPIIGARCPSGSHLSAFPMPIYDSDGLFVIGYKTVWYCLPDDLEPAG